MDAGVEPQAADRIVDVRRVPAEEYATAAKLLRDALVHVVQVEVQIVALRLRHVDASEPRAHRCIR